MSGSLGVGETGTVWFETHRKRGDGVAHPLLIAAQERLLAEPNLAFERRTSDKETAVMKSSV